MGWGLEVFTQRESQVAEQDLETRLAAIAPQLAVAARGPIEEAHGGDWHSLLLLEREARNAPQASISVLDFQAECEADPRLFPVLEKEIAATDADGTDIDKEYRNHLMSLLRAARRHYIVTTCEKDSVEQERAVVQVTYALSQLAGGLVHDLQSGAWMDPELFESLLAAYGAEENRASWPA